MSSHPSSIDILRGPIAFVALALVSAGGLALSAEAQTRRAAAPAPSAAMPVSFDTFRLIGAWNIFDPNRVDRSLDETPQPTVDTISFVGTMQYEKGLFAFFDSPDRAYRQALHEGDAIAQFKVKRIMADRVELTRDSKSVSLAIGQQLRRPQGGDWSVGADVREEQAKGENAAPPIPADASDLLKRLMEKAKQSRQ
jgi:hypothetical protein